MAKIKVLNRDVTIFLHKDSDYICLTDIARYRDAERTDYIIQNWLRNRNTIEFLGLWEQLNNADFKPIEFDGFKKQAGLDSHRCGEGKVDPAAFDQRASDRHLRHRSRPAQRRPLRIDGSRMA